MAVSTFLLPLNVSRTRLLQDASGHQARHESQRRSSSPIFHDQPGRAPAAGRPTPLTVATSYWVRTGRS